MKMRSRRRAPKSSSGMCPPFAPYSSAPQGGIERDAHEGSEKFDVGASKASAREWIVLVGSVPWSPQERARAGATLYVTRLCVRSEDVTCEVSGVTVLADFGTYYPGATNDDYEIAGFFWWQVRVCERVCTPIMGCMVTDR